ncbi:MAG: EI24 domain-containing protein [Lentisphaerales bacterium]|nr:EI24 domain-containing protein [Lentisphaerales bacterium]
MGEESNNTPTYNFLDTECRKVNGILLMNKGRKAFKEVPGLYLHYIKGVLLTLTSAVILFFTLYSTLYKMWILPFLDSYLTSITNWSGWLSWIATPVYWLIIVVLWSLLAYISMKLSTAVLGMWIDSLLQKIIRHFRNIPEEPFSMKKIVKIMLAGFKLSIGNMLLSLFFFLLGLFPFIGPFMTFIGLSCSSGFDIKTPYVMLIGEDNPEKYKEFKLRKRRLFKIGYIHGIISLIPVLGWFMLPASLLLQMAGYTYFCEEKWQQKRLTA